MSVLEHQVPALSSCVLNLGDVPGHGHEVRPRRRHGLGVPLLPRHELVARALARDPEHLRVRVDADYLTPAASEKHGQRPRSASKVDGSLG